MASAGTKPSKAASRIDARLTSYAPPVDFSFLSINSVQDLPDEEARSGEVVMQKVEKKPETPPPSSTQVGTKMTLTSSLSYSKVLGTSSSTSTPAAEKKEPEIIEVRKYRATSVRLYNNNLKKIAGLKAVLDQLLVSGGDEVVWLDLSFNKLRRIEEELQLFPKLHTLNLQGNEIHDWNDIAMLTPLTSLKTLELHGNPIDQLKNYRILVVAAVPQLKKLDSTLISPRERDLATRWFEMNRLKLPKMMSERLPFAEKEKTYDDDDDDVPEGPGRKAGGGSSKITSSSTSAKKGSIGRR